MFTILEHLNALAKCLQQAFLLVVHFLYEKSRYIFGNKKFKCQMTKPVASITPIAVNYHFTRKCNYSCGFCFHTAKTSHLESLDNMKLIMKSLHNEGCRKINFAGGEPFLPDHRTKLGEMVKYAKLECGYESVSIISNGSYVTEAWFVSYSKYLDILGISCDSEDDEINNLIGRGKNSLHVEHVRRAAILCKKYDVMFKLNSVVNSYNWDKDMSCLVNQIDPVRWKIFQVLKLEGENDGNNTIRDVTRFLISKDQFSHFVNLHKQNVKKNNIIKVEDNSSMQSSYILVDEYGCFLDSSTGGKVSTDSILKVGIKEALHQLAQSKGGGFNYDAFIERDGLYQTESWSKSTRSNCCTSSAPTFPSQDDSHNTDSVNSERIGTEDIEDLLKVAQ